MKVTESEPLAGEAGEARPETSASNDALLEVSGTEQLLETIQKQQAKINEQQEQMQTQETKIQGQDAQMLQNREQIKLLETIEANQQKIKEQQELMQTQQATI